MSSALGWDDADAERVSAEKVWLLFTQRALRGRTAGLLLLTSHARATSARSVRLVWTRLPTILFISAKSCSCTSSWCTAVLSFWSLGGAVGGL